MQKVAKRTVAIAWLYIAAIGHLIIGISLPWIANLAFFEDYHHSIEVAFWPAHIPEGARALHVWWLSLFGPTLQTLAILMAALIYVGERYRNPVVWLSLFLSFAVWAPQDILISLEANAWTHVWVDVCVIAVLLPPLAWLWWQDRSLNNK